MTFPQYLTVARWLTASYCLLLPLISSSCAFVQGARYEYSKTPQKSQEYHVKGKTKHPTNRNKSWRKWTITLKPRKTLTNVQGTIGRGIGRLLFLVGAGVMQVSYRGKKMPVLNAYYGANYMH